MVETTKRGRQSKRRVTAVKTVTVPSTCPLPSPQTPNTSHPTPTYSDELSERCVSCSNDTNEPKPPLKKVVYWIQCSHCDRWYHPSCAGLSPDEYSKALSDKDAPWHCHNCSEIPDFPSVPNRPYSWGNHSELTLPAPSDSLRISLYCCKLETQSF